MHASCKLFDLMRIYDPYILSLHLNIIKLYLSLIRIPDVMSVTILNQGIRKVRLSTTNKTLFSQKNHKCISAQYFIFLLRKRLNIP